MNGFVKLRILGTDIDFVEISNKLGQEPDFSYHKGDVYIDKIIKNRIITYEEDCWFTEVQKREDETIEECVEKFLFKISHASDYLKQLSNMNRVSILISLYPEDIQINFKLSNNTLSNLNDMGVDVEVDTYFLQCFYDGVY